MTDLRSELKAKWREAEVTGKSDREWRGIALAVSAPVQLIAGIREPDNRIALLLEAPISAAPRSTLRLRADGVSLADQRRPDEGIYRLAITLEHEGLRDVFEVLAADVIDFIRPTHTAIKAMEEAAKRLETWQACLRSRKQALSREEQIGLMGEFTVLRMLANQIGYRVAVESWGGPLDGIHDFSRVGIAIEVKTEMGGSKLLHISNLAQLESSGLDVLAIARVRFREGTDGKSISDTVRDLREEIGRTETSAISNFDDKLLRSGYLDVDKDFYDPLRFVLVEAYGILVREDFPRLTPSSVPSGIVDGTYTIDERVVANFRIESEQFDQTLRRMAGKS